MAGLYLGSADPRSPLAAPIYADLKGLAPLLIQVGAAETLLDDAIRLAKAAGADDVRVDLQIWLAMVHVWHMFHPELKAGKHAIQAGWRLHTRGHGSVASFAAMYFRGGNSLVTAHFAGKFGWLDFRTGKVFRVLSGAVDIVRELDGEPILLGTVGAGQFIGEMGVVEADLSRLVRPIIGS